MPGYDKQIHKGNPSSPEIDFVLIEDVSKQFKSVDAVCNVNLRIKKGVIFGLVGSDGAGKSTLIKILTGVHQPDGGEIYFKGEKITIHSVEKSRELGIETVYQEQALSEQQNMWRNIFMGREITGRFGFLKVEEERSADAIVQKLKLMADAPGGMYMLDNEMGQRVFTPPAAEGGQ